MQVQILQADLTKGLGIVTRAAAARAQLPILSNVLLQATKEGLLLAATNLELGLRVAVGGKVTQEGAITIPARTLGEFVASLGSGQLQLETEGEKLKVTSSNSSATFTGISATEFPPLNTPSVEAKSLTLPQKALAALAAQVVYACATDESRPVLTGVQFKTVSGNLVVTATDGFRMSQKRLENVELNIDNLILPARTIQEVAKLSEGEKDVQMQLVSDTNQAVFKLDNIEVFSRVLEGNFPDVAKIIPSEITMQAIVDREAFLKAMRAAGIFARENNNILKLLIDDGRITIKAIASQLGENSTEVEAETDGDKNEISFNYKFVTDFLSSSTEERVVFKMNSSTTPGIFGLEKDTSLVHLIMPVRVQN